MSSRRSTGWRVCLGLGSLLVAMACGESSAPGVPEPPGDGGFTPSDAGTPPSDAGPDAGPRQVDPFADRVVSFQPGEAAGFGQDLFPGVVLGPPRGEGSSQGSLDVLSLGRQGVIVLEFTDWVPVDGPGVDLLVFENPFGRFAETGVVAVSDDGLTWHEFPCDATNPDAGYPGCAGVHPVFSHPDNGISPTDPSVAGGDGFDLSEVGVSRARFVRIRDSGANGYGGIAGGFDLDAVSVVHGEEVSGGSP
ncbi:cell surface protein [Hyalangium versicolor]|uniref:cell surface protein n=1 Tax=Hyalangium versicolor TaxID=2861190 RepID=UPI001CCC01ED|nr:cell surface protein [Hyalangium versicolor]